MFCFYVLAVDNRCIYLRYLMYAYNKIYLSCPPGEHIQVRVVCREDLPLGHITDIVISEATRMIKS